MERDLLIRRIARLRKEGMSIRGIADELGMHRSSVHRAVKSLESAARDASPRFSGITAGDFVGRERELTELNSLLSDVISGEGRLALIAGEPGIGKTRTVAEFSDHARRRGCIVLWGRIHENAGTPPYWPWIQVLRSLAEELDPEELASCLGDGVPELIALVPALRISRRDAVAPDLQNPQQSMFRLFDSVTSLLQRASHLRTMVIVLDNLHRADRDSLLLYQFAANQLDQHRICVLATYRDTDLELGSEYSEMLDNLPRSPSLVRITLPRFNREETARYLDRATGIEASEALTDGIYRSTDGNPLFISEVARMILQEHGSNRAIGAGGESISVRIPDGVKEVIGRRLNHLSDGAARLLRTASVLGREFSIAELTHCLPGVPAGAFDDALNEVTVAAFIHEIPGEPGLFRFSHSLMNVTIYDSLSHRFKTHLHQRIARWLAETSGDDAKELGRIAHHYVLSANQAMARIAVEYLERAGSAAVTSSAFGDAETHYRSALEQLERWEPSDLARRGRILVELGLAQRKSGAFTRARETLAMAADVALRVDDTQLLARAAIEFAESGFYPGITGQDAASLLEQALSRVPEGDSPERARLLGTLSRATAFAGRTEQASEYAATAVEMARRTGDAGVLARTLRDAIFPKWSSPGLIGERIRMAEELMTVARSLGDEEFLSEAHAYRLFNSLELGDITTVDLDIEAKQTIGLRIRSPEIIYMTQAWRSMRALLAGDFAEAEKLAMLAKQTGSRLQAYGVDGVYGLQMFSIRREQGRLREIAPLVSAMATTGQESSVWRPGLAVIYSELGMRAEAARVFDGLAVDGFAAVQRDALWLISMSFLADTCAYLQDSDRARTLYEMLLPYEGRTASSGSAVVCFGAIDRYAANLAVASRDWDTAKAHYETALSVNSRLGAVPSLARTQHDFARAMIDFKGGSARTKAISLLERAHDSSRVLGMESLAQRCEEMLEELAVGDGLDGAVPARLTGREIDVLRLVAAGKSNRQIASELVISVHTVSNHVSNILAKTRSSNRAEATTFGMAAGVIGPADSDSTI